MADRGDHESRSIRIFDYMRAFVELISNRTTQSFNGSPESKADLADEMGCGVCTIVKDRIRRGESS
jgi:hypothetical protein